MMMIDVHLRKAIEYNFKQIDKAIEGHRQSKIKELKHKKGVPTVIEYQGRRYVLAHANHRA